MTKHFFDDPFISLYIIKKHAENQRNPHNLSTVADKYCRRPWEVSSRIDSILEEINGRIDEISDRDVREILREIGLNYDTMTGQELLIENEGAETIIRRYLRTEEMNGETAQNEQLGEERRNQTEEYVNFVDQFRFSMNILTNEILVNGESMTNSRLAQIKDSAYDTIERMKENRLMAKIESRASQNQFDPIADWVTRLPAWDGVDRIKELAGCFQVHENPKLSVRRILEISLATAISKWVKRTPDMRKLLGSVASLLITSEHQGVGKSFFARWLCPFSDEYYRTGKVNFQDKDSHIALGKTAMQELDELPNRVDVEQLKSFLTQETVTRRRPYAHYEETWQARTFFVTTANNVAGIFHDVENRRWLGFQVNEQINWVRYEKIDRIQLYSQAKEMFFQGKAVMTVQERDAQQEANKENRAETTMDALILDQFEITGEKENFVQLVDVAKYLIGLGLHQSDNSIARALVGLGAKRGNKKINKKHQRVYWGIKKIQKEEGTK